MNGNVGLTGQSPFAACRSVWQTPQASVLTRICPGPGVGISRSCSDSGLPNCSTIAACILCCLGDFLLLAGIGPVSVSVDWMVIAFPSQFAPIVEQSRRCVCALAHTSVNRGRAQILDQRLKG